MRALCLVVMQVCSRGVLDGRQKTEAECNLFYFFFFIYITITRVSLLLPYSAPVQFRLDAAAHHIASGARCKSPPASTYI